MPKYLLKDPDIDVQQLPVRPVDANLKTFQNWLKEGMFPKADETGRYMRQDNRHNFYHLYFYADEVELNPLAVKKWRAENKVKCSGITYDKYRHIRGDKRIDFFKNLQTILVFDTESGDVRSVGGSLRELSWTLFHYPDGQIITKQRMCRIPKDTAQQILLLEEFKNALHAADLLVGHNIMSDIKNIYCAFTNLDQEITSDDYPEVFCTSHESLLLCRQVSVRKSGSFDTIPLQALANYLGVDLSDLKYRPSNHSSIKDAEVTRRCFLELMKLNDDNGFLYKQ